MKPTAITALLALTLFGFCGAFTAPYATADSSVQLLTMHSSPSPEMNCDFIAELNDADELMGMSFRCNGEDLEKFGVAEPRTLSLGQLQREVVFMRESTFDMVVITISAPNVDPATGGQIRLRYLTNAIFRNYSVFVAEVRKVGSRWVVYTSDARGRHPFSHVEVETYLLGVDDIKVR